MNAPGDVFLIAGWAQTEHALRPWPNVWFRDRIPACPASIRSQQHRWQRSFASPSAPAV